jgi:hypothetical protein
VIHVAACRRDTAAAASAAELGGVGVAIAVAVLADAAPAEPELAEAELEGASLFAGAAADGLRSRAAPPFGLAIATLAAPAAKTIMISETIPARA